MKFSSYALHHRSVWSLNGLPRADLMMLVDTAARLKVAARAGMASTPLRGKHLALVSGGSADPSDLLRSAASELGAKVTLLHAGDPLVGLNGSARLLGRLYEAVDCESMAPSLVRNIECDAGVPVFNGLASDDHPTRVLAVLLALHEASDQQLAGLRLTWVGDLDTPCGVAMRQAAERLGLELRTGTGVGADFVLDTRDPARWQLADRQGRIVEGESDHRRYALQALLLSTLT